MSNSRSRSGKPTSTGLWSVSLASALFALLALAFSVPSSFAGTGLGGDGDSVGSLPGTHSDKGNGSHGLAEDLADQFRLTLTGDKAQIQALVAEYVPGEGGYYTREGLGTPGLERVTFIGAGRVELDRALLEASFVAVQLELGPVFAGGRLQVQVGQTSSLSPALPGTLPLHLQQLSWSGTLERDVALRATQADGQVGSLDIQFSGPGSNRIVLTQQY